MLLRYILLCACVTMAIATDQQVSPTDLIEDIPSLYLEYEIYNDGYGYSNYDKSHAHTSEVVELERRSYAEYFLEKISTEGLEKLSPQDQRRLIEIINKDHLLTHDESDNKFRQLCVKAAEKITLSDWWVHSDRKVFFADLLDAVISAQSAHPSRFYQAFDQTGDYDMIAARILEQSRPLITSAASLSDLDRVEHIARTAYTILAVRSHSSPLTFQELPLYADLIRRRHVLRQ